MRPTPALEAISEPDRPPQVRALCLAANALVGDVPARTATVHLQGTVGSHRRRSRSRRTICENPRLPLPARDDISRSASLNSDQLKPPAPNPCETCPYRRDVPSGIWDVAEYEKLSRYDADTVDQPQRLFQCHLTDLDNPRRRRVCAGWAGCHDTDNLLAIRLALLDGRISLATADAIRDYQSPVPLFGSGAEAAAHGMKDIADPSAAARIAIEKIQRIRTDITS